MRVFSTIAMGKYFSVDQLPMLPADACDQLVLRFSTNPIAMDAENATDPRPSSCCKRDE